jgi:hypothetical protein
MSVKPRSHLSDDLLPSNDYPQPQSASQPALKIVSDAAAPVAQRPSGQTAGLPLPALTPPAKSKLPTGDPLAAIKAMSEEEKIALFS